MIDLKPFLTTMDASPAVAVIGDIMLDQTVTAAVDSTAPDAPVVVARESRRDSTLGGAAHVAACLAGLGTRPLLFGRLGRDDASATVASLCPQADVRLEAVYGHFPTTVKRSIHARSGQKLFRHDIESDQSLLPGEQRGIVSAFRNAVASEGFCAAVISDYHKGVCTSGLLVAILEICARESIPVFIDPKPSNLAWWSPEVRAAMHAVACVKVNRHEAAEMLSIERGSRPSFAMDIRALAEQLRRGLPLMPNACVIVTNDASGAMMSVDGEQDGPRFVPSRRVDGTPDPNGAGDATLAAIVAARIGAAGWEHATALGMIAGAVQAGRPGTRPVTVADCVAKEIADRPLAICTLAEAALVAESIRQAPRGRSVSFTNGCFDVLHIGHVRMLREAAKFGGGPVIVGLDDDAGVRALKGEGRPLNDFQHRAEMLLALPWVLCIVPMSGGDPVPLIDAIRPDNLFKGGDYTTTAGQGIVEGYGGQTVFLAYHKGISTTALIERVQKEALP